VKLSRNAGSGIETFQRLNVRVIEQKAAELIRNKSAARVDDFPAHHREERFSFRHLLRRDRENVLGQNSQIGKLSRL